MPACGLHPLSAAYQHPTAEHLLLNDRQRMALRGVKGDHPNEVREAPVAKAAQPSGLLSLKTPQGCSGGLQGGGGGGAAP